MLRLLCVTAALFIGGGCQHTPVYKSTREPSVYDLAAVDQKEWGNYAGQTVRVIGIARDCKVSVALFPENGSMVYIDGLSRLPAGLDQKKIAATGILIYHPEREPPENGGSYIQGPYYSLASATWALAE